MEERDEAAEMLHLTLLPSEIIHNIFQWLSPDDLANLPRTCRFLNDYVKGNQRLCRDIYLTHLDRPEKPNIDWQQDLHDYVRLQRVCARDNADSKKDEILFVYNTVTKLLNNASSTGEKLSHSTTHAASRNATILARLFRNESNREAFLCRSFIFERARGEVHPPRFSEIPSEIHQQSAKLHCLYGRPILNCGRTRSSRMYPFACSKVYDLRQYTERTRWGPFLDDGSDRVDWEKVEAILIVVGSNIRNQHLTSRAFSNSWDTPFVGSWSGSYMPTPNRDLTTLDMKDPYGVAGTWLRVVCFVDYNDFFSYNFPLEDSLPANVPRPMFNVGEATRLIIMKVHVTAVEPPGEDDGKELPVVHFKGISRSLDDSWDENANSDLKGTCRLTKEGEVRWTTFSIFNGQERWRSEGVQIGGVRSARGVAGNWFDTDYDPHGPAGPTAFWKISDPRKPRGDDNQVGLNDFLPIVDGFDVDFGSDEEEDPDFTIGENGFEDEEDEEIDDEEDEGEAVAQDLVALTLPDIDIIEILYHTHHTHHNH